MFKRKDSYVLKTFLPILFLTIFAFSLFIFWGAFLEKLSIFSKKGGDFWGAFLLAIYQMPFLLSMTMPVAILTAVFFSIRRFVAFGEYKAFLAGGYSPFDLIKPFLFCALFIFTAHFIFNEFVGTVSYAKYKETYNARTRKKSEPEQKIIQAPYFSQNGFFFSAQKYNIKKKEFAFFSAEKYENEKEGRSLAVYAEKAFYDGAAGLWILENVKTADFSGKEPVLNRREFMNFKDLPKPRDLVFQEDMNEGLNFFQLKDRLGKLSSLGLKKKKEEIALLSKIASPLSVFAMILIAAALALSPALKGNSLGAGAALFVGFLFFNISLSFKRMAEIEMLSPFSGIFLPIIIFVFIAILVLKKQKAF